MLKCATVGFHQPGVQIKGCEQGGTQWANQVARQDIPWGQIACLRWKKESLHCRLTPFWVWGVFCYTGWSRKERQRKVWLDSLPSILSNLITHCICFLATDLFPLHLQGWKGVQDHHSDCWEDRPVPPPAVPQRKTEGYASRNHPSSWCCPQGVTILEVWHPLFRQFLAISFSSSSY